MFQFSPRVTQHAWRLIQLTITDAIHANSLLRIIIGLGNVLLSACAEGSERCSRRLAGRESPPTDGQLYIGTELRAAQAGLCPAGPAGTGKGRCHGSGMRAAFMASTAASIRGLTCGGAR